jgi:hypothetical protein
LLIALLIKAAEAGLIEPSIFMEITFCAFIVNGHKRMIRYRERHFISKHIS